MENLQGGTLALEHHYHLDERLDSFGLVTLYAGTQDPFDLPVRIAVYGGLAEAGADPGVAERIKVASQRSSRIHQPGLLTAIDYGEIEAGVPFVIERTVPGPSLASRLESKSVFPPSAVADLVDRLADLLQRAHDKGIYHGGLKPEWVLFPSDDAPMERAHLAHIGIGPSMSELVSMAQAVLTTDLVDAFPPECFDVAARDTSDDDGDDAPLPHLSAAADQWGLAVLAYRLLVGVHPFFDDPVDASEGILRIKTEEPPSLADMGIDDEIAEVVDRALSGNPDRRWPTIDAFADAFRRAATGAPDDETTSDGDAASPTEPASPSSQPVDGDEPESATFDAAPHGPRPSGYLLTAALAALVLSNLGWFFAILHGDATEDDEPDDHAVAQAPQPDILPAELMGTQIDTAPSDSQIVDVRDDGTEEILDTTPFSVTELLDDHTRRELLLRHPGYHDHRITIDATETRQDIEFSLIGRE